MKDRNRHPLQAMALVSIILSQLAGSVLIGLFSGRWADQWLDTEPLFLILGLLLGLAARCFYDAADSPPFFFRRLIIHAGFAARFSKTSFVHTYCIC